jgi:hypothetical protein
MTPPIALVQKRIANISVGSSTVRGQPKGTVTIARNYLQSINLKDFSNGSEDQFRRVLDEHTEKLRTELPSRSWGIARKVLNIFLFQATHDVILNRTYTFDKIIAYLEVPLDNPNAKKLKGKAKSEGKTLNWKNIYSLNPDASKEFQDIARQCASQKGYERCYLDLDWWRS